MYLKEKYQQLAAWFNMINTSETPGVEKELSPEGDKLAFMWEHCMPQGIESSTIIAKVQEKINRDKRKKKQLFIYRITAVAASVLLVVSFSLYFLYSDKNDQPVDISVLARQMSDNIISDDITLITSGEQLTVNENAIIQYSSQGEISIDADLFTPANKDKEEFNQLIVPKGKRSRIQLSDGTRLWVNARSKVVYPRLFKGDIRNIYVEGEVYLEVAPDKLHPFIVTSNGFDLKVLGTKFNISNYQTMSSSNIVLVEGSVEVKDQKNRTVRLQPSDLLSLKGGTIISQTKVDTDEYISWIKGYLILKGDKLSVIAQKLSNYFGVDISVDPSVANQKVYGKLDLKDDLSEILSCIQLTIPMKIQTNNNEIQIFKDN